MADKINIKNYTSSVPAERSISNIELFLVDIGATNISKEYKEGKVDSVSFAIKNGEGIIPFKLPAKRDAIRKLFLNQGRRKTPLQVKQCDDQAERTAWKNVMEWVQLQATMIKLGQVEMLEVFLPYMYDFESQKTLFERAKDNNYKLLN